MAYKLTDHPCKAGTSIVAAAKNPSKEGQKKPQIPDHYLNEKNRGS